MNAETKRLPIFPKFTRFPLFLAVVFHFVSYLPTKLITENSYHYDFSFHIDSLIPFSPFFVVFYVLAYVQWIFSYVTHCRAGKEICYRLITADLISKLFCMIFFILLPTTILRPEISGNSIFENIIALIYWIDTPYNLFPSMHCLMSWLCFRSSLMMKKTPAWYPWAQLVLSLFVFASTVFIKQHFFIDILSGVLVAEAAWFLSRHFLLRRSRNRT